ncbi:MAG: DUF6580 family putative transport protein [Pirellulales bacterium]
MFNARFWILAVIVLLTAALRLVPHPDNFVPVMAVALFGGAMFRSRWAAVCVPLAAMIVSDIALYTLKYPEYGWVKGVSGQSKVYLAMAAAAVLGGLFLRNRRTPVRVVSAALLASLAFYLFSNFVGFYSAERYPHNLQGQISSYIAALPFFRNALLADLFYTCALFGGFALAERYAGGWLRPAPTAVAAE